MMASNCSASERPFKLEISDVGNIATLDTVNRKWVGFPIHDESRYCSGTGELSFYGDCWCEMLISGPRPFYAISFCHYR